MSMRCYVQFTNNGINQHYNSYNVTIISINICHLKQLYFVTIVYHMDTYNTCK